MSKIIEIKTCLDCKYYKEDGWTETRYCFHPLKFKSKSLLEIFYVSENKIPKECPLENYK